ncbi:sigma 54-interacting transcriptional regulator [Pendulispora rubella]|uniref:Sigma 54-interacting transcriptional regulator n=1 Tax=Pendulispora rubella TaxID=2741070 RepID=A0ABZ2L3N6_9BACT
MSQSTTLTLLDRRRASLPSLVLVANMASTQEVSRPFGLAPIVVGTGNDCDLIVTDPAVSRRHCLFRITPQGILVRDLQSKNGTFVSNIRVQEAHVAPGHVLQIGGVSLRIRVTGEPSEIPLWPEASFGGALGGSTVMRALFHRLHQAAQSPEVVLLRGESGTGKELLARAIHDASPRADGPFVIFDAAAITPALFEAELFGHVRGAFTGADADRTGMLATADGGTLFLDEIGELPLDQQPKLLRVLESKQYRPVGSNEWRSFDARIVAATHRDLHAATAAGEFRQDLYFRLAVFECVVPPLRERSDDIELLVERFLASDIPPRTVLDLPHGALEMLASHHWPGNVRELRNTVSRLLLFPHMRERALEFHGVEGEARRDFDALLGLSWRDARERVIDRFEASYLREKLHAHDGNVAKAATDMGISRQLVHRLMVRHGIR